MAEPSFFTFLASALSALALEVPLAEVALSRALHGVDLRLSVDGDTRLLVVRKGRLDLQAPGIAGAELRTDKRVLVELLEARCTLLDAVSCDDLMLRGTPEQIGAIHDALTAFIQGAVRSVSIPELLERYLGANDPTPAHQPRGPLQNQQGGTPDECTG